MSPKLEQCNLSKFSTFTKGGGDHVTLIGHVRTGMGYGNEFQTENYGPLTNHSLLPMGCTLSHSHVEHMSMLRFDQILNVIWNPTTNILWETIHPSWRETIIWSIRETPQRKFESNRVGKHVSNWERNKKSNSNLNPERIPVNPGIWETLHQSELYFSNQTENTTIESNDILIPRDSVEYMSCPLQGWRVMISICEQVLVDQLLFLYEVFLI